jgi:hypothetical protein
MKANPGGQIDSGEVVGRDELIDQIWDTLDQQSIRMTAERRIGKTTIIKKLCAEPRSGWLPIFQDLEKHHTALEFALGVYREVERFLSLHRRTARRAQALLKSLGGTEIKGILKLPAFDQQAPWQDILTKSLEDLVEAREQDKERIVLLWDEVPYMLDNISKRESQASAMAVLDTLRALRQELAGLRMILTGSIGFHHVIRSLKDYTNSPLNDVFPLEVPPLALDAACELAEKLIFGENIATDNPPALADALAQAADGFPFYIHHLVKALKTAKKPVTPETVEDVLNRQLLDANDPWELDHYRKRITDYYGKDNEKAVLGLLDGVAVRPKPVSVNELLTELKNTGVLSDRERLIELLRLVEQDHYLARDNHGHYQFRFPLLQRWWRLSRGL